MKRINKISVITMLMLTALVPSSSIVYAIDASSSESAEEVISTDTAETLNSTSSSGKLRQKVLLAPHVQFLRKQK